MLHNTLNINGFKHWTGSICQ